MLRALKNWWNNSQIIQRPFSWSEFKWNLIVGLLVAFLLLIFPDWPFLMDTEDEYMDWVMDFRIEANLISPVKDKSHTFVLLDIDNKTFQTWGEPLFTPRDRLEYLIRSAVTAKARLVVVDLDISQASQPAPVDNSPLHPDDQALKDYLEGYVEQCKQEPDQFKCPPIIFVRVLRPPQDSNQILEPRTGFLEEIVAQGAPYLQWGSAHFHQSDDLVVRRWVLWEEACLNKQPQVVPSLELLAMAIIKEECSVAQVQTALEQFKPQSCENKNAVSQPEIAEICGIKISSKHHDINQRIMYSIRDNENGNNTMMYRFSADPYAYVDSEADLDKLTGRIVVIGNSHSEARDHYLTPVGKMPGVLIVINAIHSLLEYNVIELPPLSQKLLITGGLILLLSLFLARFCSLFGLSAGAFIIFVLFIVFSIRGLNEGMWLNFVLPLIAVEIGHAFRELFQECRK